MLEAVVGVDGKAKALSANGDWRGRRGRSRGGGREGDWVSTTGEEQELEVSPEEAREFRACAARLNYLGHNSPDVHFPKKVLSSEVSRPTTGSWRRLKKVVRFLVGRKRVVWHSFW